MIEAIKSYLYAWYLENKLTLFILGGFLFFMIYICHQYKLNFRPKIKSKTPLENLEEELRRGKINRLDYEKRKIKLMQK
ncbi:MAG: hypothetical protein V1892_00445 [bacterium]